MIKFMCQVKDETGKLYDLTEDPMAITRSVHFLLEKDRYMCSPNRYMVGAP